MHRWFDISAATKDLQFEPIIPYEEGWTETIAWFKEHWRPTFAIDDRVLGIADQSEAKIKIQSDGRAHGPYPFFAALVAGYLLVEQSEGNKFWAFLPAAQTLAPAWKELCKGMEDWAQTEIGVSKERLDDAYAK